MTAFTVILEIRFHGASVGSTEDVIEAETAEEAEQTAIALWRAKRPNRTFAPLFTGPALSDRKDRLTWKPGEVEFEPEDEAEALGGPPGEDVPAQACSGGEKHG